MEWKDCPQCGRVRGMGDGRCNACDHRDGDYVCVACVPDRSRKSGDLQRCKMYVTDLQKLNSELTDNARGMKAICDKIVDRAAELFARAEKAEKERDEARESLQFANARISQMERERATLLIRR